jgi:SAM-dependent methyltransferase
VPRRALPVGVRFWAKVDQSGGPDACWLWLARTSKGGYGRFELAGDRTVSAHQVAYALVKGQLAEGLTIDHTCRNPTCVNPAHLEPKTFRDNVLSGENPCARNARKTHCPQGHAYDPDNTYRRRDASRTCRACRAQQKRRRAVLRHARTGRNNRLMRELQENWEPRFWTKVDASGGLEGCWPWTAYRDPDGYGQLRVADTVMSAARLSLFLATGLLSTRPVHNRCPTPGCVNPTHLFTGDAGKRMRDTVARDPTALTPNEQRELVPTMAKQPNEIDLRRWNSPEYADLLTDSLWLLRRREDFGVHPAPAYHGLFAPQIPNQFLRRYTKRGEWVLDPMCGSGTTAIEALRLGRHCVAADLDLTAAAAALDQVMGRLPPVGERGFLKIEEGDARTLDFSEALEHAPGGKAQFLLLHPPYWNIVPFTDDPRDLCNAGDMESFLAGWGQVCDNLLPYLAPGRFGALVIGDAYQQGEVVPLGWLCWQALAARGMKLKGLVVKDFGETRAKSGQRALWRYRALANGFFRFSHEYLYLFWSPVGRRAPRERVTPLTPVTAAEARAAAAEVRAAAGQAAAVAAAGRAILPEGRLRRVGTLPPAGPRSERGAGTP